MSFIIFFNDIRKELRILGNNTTKNKLVKDSQINQALGLFILFFGFVIIIATFFTTTLVGQLTNLVAGVVLLGIGLGMYLKAKNNIKKINAAE